jgi:Putative prokaryotic signal transducing protein
MIEVGRFQTRAEAQFARARLAAAGIPCILSPDGATDIDLGDLCGGARLLVAEADAVIAAELLRGPEPAEGDCR